MKLVKLGLHCQVKNGYAFKSSEFLQDGIPIIRISDIKSERVSTNNAARISYSEKFKPFIVPKGSILIAMSGATTGKIGLYNEEKLAYQNQRVGRFVVDQKFLAHNYLYTFLKSKQLWIQKAAFGGGQPNISSKALEKIDIPLPSIDDQKRIAHLLIKVEKLINQRKQNIQQLNDLLKSVFLNMFSPNSKDYESWPLKEIKDLAAPHKRSMRTGPFGSNLKHDEFTVDGEVAVLGIDNAVKNSFNWSERRFISKEKYQELKNYTIFPGDVIITIMGTVGRSAVIPDDIPLAINTKHLAAITLDRDLAEPIFVSYSIHSSPYILNQFKSKNRGAIMSGLNLGIIKETKIKQPPIELQKKFAEIHTKVEKIKADYLNSLNDLESLYGALSQKAFNGELDLSKVPLPDESEENPDDISSVEQTNMAEKNKGNSILGFSQFNPESIKDNEIRKTQLTEWFNEWLEHYQQEGVLSINHFWQCIEFTTQDYVDDNDEPLKIDVSDYDYIKGEVFAAIKSGVIKQTTKMNEIEVDGEIKLVPGNQILLKKQH